MMFRPYTFLLGLRYAGARRRSQLVSFISGLSILGLTVGVGLLLTVLSVMNGFDRELREKILSILPHGAIYHRYGIEDWPALQNKIVSNPEIEAAAPFVQVQAMLSRGKRVKPALLYGIDGPAEVSVSSLHQFMPDDLYQQFGGAANAHRSESGRLELEPNQKQGLVLGQGLAQSLHADVGDAITVLVPNSKNTRQLPKFVSLRLKGVIQTGTELDYSLALLPLMAASELSEFPGRVSGIRLKTHDLFSAPEVVYQQVQQLDYGYYGSDWTRTHGNLYRAVHMSKNLVGLLLFLIVAIAAFNVVSTLIMVVVDKQGDIAILKTLGASRSEVMAVFMVQGTLIGAIGTVLGLLLGVAGSLLAQKLVAVLERLFHVQFLNAEIYPVSYLPSQIQWPDFALVGVVSLLMSVVATLYPAWRASRVAPADALRYE